MTDIAIKAEDLGKLYRIGKRERYKALRDSMSESISDLFRSAMSRMRGDSSTDGSLAEGFIWALRNVCFEIKLGEVVGVIGRNGAGKSTLLKVLSRITSPTEGQVEIHGRVGCLLEVGCGFHPELTGRENIFLNGAILSMRRVEIIRKFDEIVAFAEVEKFIDTPVKHYSSGMHMRLAFAVAAHLEPEILLVDEVLAVGDFEFQKKCLGKMKDVSAQGRTVLFVSHNMAAVAQLCQRGMLLESGQLIYSGEIQETIGQYLSKGRAFQAEVDFPTDPSKQIQVKILRILDDQGRLSLELDRAKPFHIEIELTAHQSARGTIIFELDTAQGTRVCHSVLANFTRQFTVFDPERPARITVKFPGNLLNEGIYKCTFHVVMGNIGLYDFVASPFFSLLDIAGRESFIGERKRDLSVLNIPLEWVNQTI